MQNSLWFDVNIDYCKTEGKLYAVLQELWFDVNIDYCKTPPITAAEPAGCGLM